MTVDGKGLVLPFETQIAFFSSLIFVLVLTGIRWLLVQIKAIEITDLLLLRCT